MRAALWRRRHLLLSIALIAAVIAAVEILRPAPAGSAVVIVTERVEAGEPLSAGALEIGVTDVVPDEALTSLEDAVGLAPAVSLPPGTVLSESFLIERGIVESAPIGTTVLPVAVADPGSAALATPCRTVLLLGTNSSGVEAEALVLAVLPPEPGSTFGTASQLTTLLLAVHNDSINVVSDASALAPLRIALRIGVHSDNEEQ